MTRKFTLALLTALSLGLSAPSWAADYAIDTKGAHAFVQFKVAHLGYSWLLGRFNDFEGSFSYDEKNPSAAKVTVTINTGSVDSNHAERDKHLRSDDFLNVQEHPQSTFVSTSFKEMGDGKAELKGNFTLNGVTRPITIAVKHIGAGADPWGGYRRGFEGTTTIALKDYAINYDLGPASSTVELFFSLEGIRN